MVGYSESDNMSKFIIDFAAFTAFTQEVVLDNIPYRLSFNWNTRGGFWSMSIADRDEVKLLSGIKLVMNYGLIRRYPGRGQPPGEFIVADPSLQIEKAERNDFQDKISLVYISEDEF